MATEDVAVLGLAVDSTGVDRGREALDRLTQAGAKAEKATESLKSASDILSRSLGETDRQNRLNVSTTERFVQALKQQADTIGLSVSQLRAYEAAQLDLNEAQRASVEASLRALEAHERNQQAADRGMFSITNLRSGLVALAAAYVSVNTVVGGGRAIIDAALAQEKLFNTLKVGTGSAELARDELLFLRRESENLGLQFNTTAQQYAKFVAATKDTALEGQAARDIFLGLAKASTAIGLSADEAGGALLAMQQMVSKGKVSAEELTGQLGERLPGALQIASRALNRSTADLLDMMQKGQLTADVLLPALARELEKTYGVAAQDAAQGLNAKINRLENSFHDLKLAIGRTGLLDMLANGITLATQFANALSGAKTVSALEQQRQKIQEIQDQLERKKGINAILPFNNLIYNKTELDLLEHKLETATEEYRKMEEAAKQTGTTVKKATEEDTAALEKYKQMLAEAAKVKKDFADPVKVRAEREKELNELLKKNLIDQGEYNRAMEAANKLTEKSTKVKKTEISESKRFAEQIKKEADAIGKTTFELKRAEAARLGLGQSVLDLIDKMEREEIAAKELKDELARVKQITDETATAQEKWNKRIDELERLKPKLGVEAYTRAVANANKELNRAAQETKRVTGEVNQLWIQTGRNVQNIMGNAIFDAWSSGLDSMVDQAERAVIRILAEFAGLKLSESLGITDYFTVDANGMRSSKSRSSTGDIVSGSLSGANLIKNGYSLVKGGLRGAGRSLMGFVGGGSGAGTGAFSNAGGAGTSFIGGPGTALGGSGMGVTATATSFASGAATIAAAYAGAIMLGAKMAGDKQVFGKIDGTTASVIGAVLGGPFGALTAGFLTGAFGHEAPKFRQQALTGTLSSDGFGNGEVTNIYRQKGGWFRGNKHKETHTPLTAEMDNTFDFAIQAFYQSTHEFAENLGMDVQLVDGFTKEILLKSEKGKELTSEAIEAMLSGLNDSLAENLLPNIALFKRGGETSAQTLQRLNDEFMTLEGAATALGHSVADSRKYLLENTDFLGRGQFLAQAGGMEALAQSASFFAANFLTAEEQLRPAQERLNTELTELGLSTDLTHEQFKALVQSFGSVNGVSEDTLISLLKLAPAFIAVRDAQEALTPVVVDNSAAIAENIETLTTGAKNLGASSRYATQLVNQMSTDAQAAFIEMAGGAQALLSKTQYFFTNVLNDEQRLAQANQDLMDGLGKLNLTKIPSLEEFVRLIQDPSTPNGFRDAMLDLAPVFMTVTNAIKNASEDIKIVAEDLTALNRSNLADAFDDLQQMIDKDRTAATEKYKTELDRLNTSISTVSSAISRLESFADALKNTVNSIAPLGLDAAKDIIRGAISSGDMEAEGLDFAIKSLTSLTSKQFNSSFEMRREEMKSRTLLTDLSTKADDEIDHQKALLAMFNAEKTVLEDGFRQEMEHLDDILEQGQREIDAVNGLGTAVTTLSDAIKLFNTRLEQAGGSGGIKTPDGKIPKTGNPGISDKMINDFVNTPGRTDMEIYNAAKKHGVSFVQFAKATGRNLSDLESWAKKNNLPTFANGGQHFGGLRLVGEKGPEIEFTGPSRISSNRDVSRMLDNREVIAELKLLRKAFDDNTKEARKSAEQNRKTAKTLGAVTQGGTRFRTQQEVA